MKVVYCLVDLVNPGGIERVTTDKVNALVEEPGIEFAVVTVNQKGAPFFPLKAKVPVFNLGISLGGALHRIGGIVFRLRQLRKMKLRLEEVLLQENADICVFVARSDFLLFPFKIWKGKIVMESHFTLNSQRYLQRCDSFFRKGVAFFSKKISMRLRRRADAFVVLTKYDRERLSKKEGNVFQIYNPAAETATRSSLSSKKVIAVGRLTFQKGFSLLVSAWETVAKDFPDWTLDIWGEGELRDELQAQIENANLQEKVFLRGRTENVAEKYEQSSLFVLSSIFEGFPMVLLEACSYGLPMVSFDCETGPREIIEDGISGFLVPPENVEALAEKIKIVLSMSHEERVKMGQAAIEQSEKFSPNKIANEWKKLFQRLTS